MRLIWNSRLQIVVDASLNFLATLPLHFSAPSFSGVAGLNTSTPFVPIGSDARNKGSWKRKLWPEIIEIQHERKVGMYSLALKENKKEAWR